MCVWREKKNALENTCVCEREKAKQRNRKTVKKILMSTIHNS